MVRLTEHPADRKLSPYTGWTRGHWEAAADQMLLAVRPYAGPGNALRQPNKKYRAPRWSLLRTA